MDLIDVVKAAGEELIQHFERLVDIVVDSINSEYPPAQEETEEKTDALTHRFTYHPPKGNQPQRYEDIRKAGRHLAWQIRATTPLSMEQDEALKSVDQAVMWANAAIARHE